MTINNIFDILNNINSNGKDLFQGDEAAKVEKLYSQFMVNRGLSYHKDTVLVANYANVLGHLDKKTHYTFLKSAVRPGKRFSKWSKPEKSDLINMIAEIYQCNLQHAKNYASMLSKEQIDEIIKNNNKGG